MSDDIKKPVSSKTSQVIIITMIFVVLICVTFAGALYMKNHQSALPRPAERQFQNLKLQRLEFPELSEGARDAFTIKDFHQGFRSEWWYVNTHLVDEQKHRYTMMLTFLNSGAIYCIFSSVDAQKAHTIYGPAQIQIDPETNTLSTPNFNFYQPDTKYFCYQLNVDQPTFSLELNMCANKAPLEIDGTGTITMGKFGKSYYYSLTDLTVAGKGRLGQNQIKLRGKGWIDRQWGNWSNDDFDQWKWLSIQLGNGMEIMTFKFIRNGRSISPQCDIVMPDGTQEHKLRFTLDTVDNWVSPETEVSWSSGWILSIPEKNIELKISPDFPNQEVFEALWEGGCVVEGTMGEEKVWGRAFYEERRRTWEDRKRQLMGQGVQF